MIKTFIINKSDITDTKIIREAQSAHLEKGQVLLKLDRFGLSSNNLTYAAFGESFEYWSFFPTQRGWGQLPVWGFATVEESACEEITVGERIFGFFPLATHLIVKAVNVRRKAFTDGAAHRANLPPYYNQYVRSANDPMYDPNREGEHVVLSPLFATSYLLANFVMEKEFFGAAAILITSASSKTAIGTAYLVRNENLPDITVIGLTSKKNKAFVEQLELYDAVLTYDDLSLIESEATLFLDFSGNRSLLREIHETLGNALKYSCVIGATHWDTIDGPDATLESAGKSLPGPTPSMFHAPNQGRKRRKEIGAEQFANELAKKWRQFTKDSQTWLTLQERSGLDAAESVYHQFLNGIAHPNMGYVVKLT